MLVICCHFFGIKINFTKQGRRKWAASNAGQIIIRFARLIINKMLIVFVKRPTAAKTMQNKVKAGTYNAKFDEKDKKLKKKNSNNCKLN